MSRDKTVSKPRRRRNAVPALGAAGLSLTLVSGASAAIHRPTAVEAPVQQEITLAEEEMSGASLATFHVFDRENGAKPQHGPRLAMGVGGCGGCAGCGGCWTGTYYNLSVFGDGGYVQPRPARPHRYTGSSKRAPRQ
jgi:hypothetical protein